MNIERHPPIPESLHVKNLSELVGEVFKRYSTQPRNVTIEMGRIAYETAPRNTDEEDQAILAFAECSESGYSQTPRI